MRKFSLLVLATIMCLGAMTKAAQSTEPLVITGVNGLKVVYDQATGSFEAWSGDVKFISQGKMRRAGGEARSLDLNSSTKGIEVSYDDGSEDLIFYHIFLESSYQ